MDLCSELKKEIGLFSALRLKCVGVILKPEMRMMTTLAVYFTATNCVKDHLEQHEDSDEKEDGQDGGDNDLDVEGGKLDHDWSTLLLHQEGKVCQVVALAHSSALVCPQHPTSRVGPGGGLEVPEDAHRVAHPFLPKVFQGDTDRSADGQLDVLSSHKARRDDSTIENLLWSWVQLVEGLLAVHFLVAL